MKLQQNKVLKNQNTLRLNATAEWYCEAFSLLELLEALEFARKNRLQVIPIGAGSNCVFADNLSGLVIKNRIAGINYGTDLVHASSGENWHSLVYSTISSGLFGLENLAAIPGTVGAAPVQNIGAYGVELSDRLISLEAVHIFTSEQHTFNVEECQFSYRDSAFKKTGDWIITQITLSLSKVCDLTISYPGLESYLTEKKLPVSGQSIFEAVSQIRAEKLPDPLVTPNVGSFFKNPTISREQGAFIARSFPRVPQFSVDGGKKLSAAALIDDLGLKRHQVGDFAVSKKHALVLINKGNGTQQQLSRLVLDILEKVREEAGIDLEIEPKIYPDEFLLQV